MRVYHDWEFHDRGRKGTKPISVGLFCPEKDMRYYAIFDDIGTIEEAVQDDWLRANVFNSLPFTLEKEGDWWYWDYDSNHSNFSDVKLYPAIRTEMRDFFAKIDDVELWGWYCAYDHYLLGSTFGRMLDLPAGVPMWTNDLRQEAHRLGVDPRELPQQTEGHHNALADAEHMPVIHSYLEAEERGAKVRLIREWRGY